MTDSLNFKTFYDVFRDLSNVVHSSTNVDEVLELVVWKITDVLQAKGAVLRILNLETNESDQFVSYGMSEKYLLQDPISKNDTIYEICKLNKVIVIEDILSHPRVRKQKGILEEGVKMIIDLPLILRTNILGMIRIFLLEKRTFSEAALDFAIAIAEQCACAIDKARLFQEQESQYQHLALQTEKLSALGRMAAGIAHEINNPLAGILLFSTNISKKVEEEGPVKEGLGVITREALRCKGIIQDLLEFSRDKEPKKVLANLNDVIEKSLSIINNEMRLHHISLDKDLSRDMPDTPMDVTLMQQVIINLLINAVEAIQENGKISIKSFVTPDDKKGIIEVSDTGYGIPSAHMDKIFDPFFSSKANGTGLGLAVSYGIVQKHQGHIRVDSQEGQGATFTIEIPFDR